MRRQTEDLAFLGAGPGEESTHWMDSRSKKTLLKRARFIAYNFFREILQSKRGLTHKPSRTYSLDGSGENRVRVYQNTEVDRDLTSDLRREVGTRVRGGEGRVYQVFIGEVVRKSESHTVQDCPSPWIPTPGSGVPRT